LYFCLETKERKIQEYNNGMGISKLSALIAGLQAYFGKNAT